jgi:lipopolysaccharide export system protein LptC
MILLAVAVIGLGSIFALGLVSAQTVETDQNQVSEFRSDGVEIVHYQDGSKLYRASMNDGISTSDDLR